MTIGWAVGVIMNQWGVSSCCINPPVAKAHHRNHANTPRNTTKSNPHPPKPPRPSGVTIVGSDNRDCHTHNLAEPLCTSGSRHHWHLAVYQAPTSRLCGHARRRSTSTPRGQAQTTQTQPGSSCCVPFGDPYVHKETRSDEPRQVCNHSNASHWCQPTIWRRHTISTTSPKEEKEGVHQQRILC